MVKPVFVKKLKKPKSNTSSADLTASEVKKSAKKTAEAMERSKKGGSIQFIEVE